MDTAELCLYVAEYNDKCQREQKQKQAELYMLAAMISRFVWAKQLPKFEQMFGDNQPVSDEELYAYVQNLNRQLGGTEE